MQQFKSFVVRGKVLVLDLAQTKAAQTLAFALVAAAVLTTLLMPQAPAFASVTLDFDLDPFFTALNNYLPIFIGLFAIIGGIAGAMALANFVIGKVVDAFSGRM